VSGANHNLILWLDKPGTGIKVHIYIGKYLFRQCGDLDSDLAGAFFRASKIT
jgi:hypothetical protein